MIFYMSYAASMTVFITLLLPEMRQYFFGQVGRWLYIFLFALSLSYLITPPMRWLAKRLAILDIPEARKIHQRTTPLLGGVAIIIPFSAAPLANMVLEREIMLLLYAGGALAVANHGAGFCHDGHLVTVLGAPNSYEEFIRGHLKPNVTAHFIVRDDAPTIVKRRFVDPFLISKMFEVCYLNESYLPAAQQSDLRGHLQAVIADYDVVLVTDFGHGMLDRETIALVTASARFLAVNTQANSLNLGYNVISNYPRADYVCIDQEELRLAARDRLTPVRDLIPRLARQVGAATVNVTLGTHGSVSYRHEEGMADVPVFTNEVVDSIGAGDAYLAVTAPCVAAGLPAEVIGFIGNCVGALAVQIVGNKESVEPTALFKFITTLLK